MDDMLTIFIAITAAAVVLQMLILLGMLLAVRKLSARMEVLTDETQSRVFPILEDTKKMQEEVNALLETSRPKLDLILDNLAHVTTTARADLERVQVTLNEILDRARLQTIRADQMLTRTLDSVEDTTERVQRSVAAPVRQVSGVMQAISVGLGAYFSGQRRRRNGGPNDEMFI